MSQFMIATLLLSVILVGSACDIERPRSAKVALEPRVETVPDVSTRWELLPGKGPTAPKLPAAMIDWNDRCFLVHGDRISEYEPATNTWKANDFALPGEVGSGVALAVDPKGSLFIFRGGETRDFWRWDIEARELDVLTMTPKPVGVGAALTYDYDKELVYALRGNESRDFLRYDLKSKRWKPLTKVGGKVRLAAIGQSTGALQYSKGIVYAWPDHHIQRYDPEAGTWLGRVHMSYGHRPWWDGQMYAQDRETDVWFVLQGMNSRTYSLFDPNRRKFNFLKPRLPLHLSGEGNRAVVVKIDGEKHLLVYAVAQGNRMMRIKLKDIERIDAKSPASDIGSEFLTLHENAGSSLVRRAAPKPVLGIMGKAAGKTWYFARLKNVRFLDPAKNKWTKYPGVSVGEAFRDGVCGAYDGEDHVYVLTGNSDNFQRVSQSKMKGEKLPNAPAKALIGAAMAAHSGRIYALLGGETRKVAAYTPKLAVWGDVPSLPLAADPVGKAGSALIDIDGKLVAISGQTAWVLEAGNWKKFIELPLALSADGGQAAYDAKTKKLFLVRGGGERDLAIVDLANPKNVESKLLPDVVSVAGQRALVGDILGKRFFAVMRGHDSHEINLLEIKKN